MNERPPSPDDLERWHQESIARREAARSAIKPIDRTEYVTKALSYAKELGWVRSTSEQIEAFFANIYDRYISIIDQYRAETEVAPDDLLDIIQALNGCLESTRRLGSTDKENVMRTLADALSSARRLPEPYAELAVQDFMEFIETLSV